MNSYDIPMILLGCLSWQKKGRTLTLADTIIAAVAIEERCVLLTDNRKDFPMRELNVYPLP